MCLLKISLYFVVTCLFFSSDLILSSTIGYVTKVFKSKSTDPDHRLNQSIYLQTARDIRTKLFPIPVIPFRIIGGRPAAEGEFPYQVSIRLSYNDEHICGGSILTPRHILTAAHCLFYVYGAVRPPFIISVVAGQLDLPIIEASVYSNASAIIVHEDYVYGEWHEDIAIIELETELPLDSSPIISAIGLRENGLDGGRCIVSGWGIEEYEAPEISEILLVAEVNIVEFSVCQEMYGLAEIELYDSMMCAGHQNGETDACEGDSGGPLVCNGLLTGVVSTGVECGLAEFPGIYTDVSKFVDWIKENVDLPLITTSSPPTSPPSSSFSTSESPESSSISSSPSTPSYLSSSSSESSPNTQLSSGSTQTSTPSTANFNSKINVFLLVIVSVFMILPFNGH